MEGIVKLAVTLLTDIALNRATERRPPHRIAAVACGAVAMLAAFAAIGFLLAALWHGMVPTAGPAGASLICAGVLLAVCIVLVIAALLFLRRPAPPPQIHPLVDLLQNVETGGEFLRHHKFDFLLGAIAAGIFAGMRNSSRRKREP